MAMNSTSRFGPGVDAYLFTQGALAQAVDRDTILVSSKVLGMSPLDQRLILLHERAHLEQLATPGDDPVRALEAEAWEAAHACVNGRGYRIRGRARGPLNATAIVQGGKEGHPHAPPWYRSNPVEPIGNKSTISVKDTVLFETVSLESVFDQMIAAKGEKEFVLVSHGSGAGLDLPLMVGATGGAERDVMWVLAADRPGEDVGFDGTKIKTPKKSDKDVADLTRLSESQVATLRAKMNQVRGMNLKHVAFRACNMGISKETMLSFRAVLGAASVSAPILFDSYGTFSPTILGDLDAWVKSKRKLGFQVSVDGQVGFGTRNSDQSRVYAIVSAAVSKDAFTAWIKKHIADGAWGSNGVIFHGMKVLHVLGKDAPSVYFVRDADFVSNIVYQP
jgi:hypothetical protein